MSIGLSISKSEIDTRIGDLSRSFQSNMIDVETLKLFMDATPNADLEALGYTTQEVANIKTAINDLFQLRSIWFGTQNLTVAKDFTTFVRRLWGVGAF